MAALPPSVSCEPPGRHRAFRFEAGWESSPFPEGDSRRLEPVLGEGSL